MCEQENEPCRRRSDDTAREALRSGGHNAEKGLMPSGSRGSAKPCRFPADSLGIICSRYLVIEPQFCMLAMNALFDSSNAANA